MRTSPGILFLIASTLIIRCHESRNPVGAPGGEDATAKYENPFARYQLEFQKMRDPALGYVPYERLDHAINFTIAGKQNAVARNESLAWQERGPIYDFFLPNADQPRGFTAGRVRAVLVDTLNDPTGNTVFCGGVAGGLWRCTNFMSGSIPNWQPLNDHFDNLAVSSICQDPSNPSIMYFATGEPTVNQDAVFGRGIWKSVNAGLTWTHLPSTATFTKSFKIVCDAVGNIYLAAHPLTFPVMQPASLLRSKDGGSTWTNITPNNIAPDRLPCTDIEISSTGKLHASLGYFSNVPYHRFTADPAGVTPATWNSGTGIRSVPGAPPAKRMEIACVADTLYAITINSAYSADSCYKSIDGGFTWTLQNTTTPPLNIAATQGWYNLTLAINPNNTSEIIAGGLDAYRSTDNGQTFVQATHFGNIETYVHVDHHFMQWWHAGSESRILIGGDGGLYLSRNNGVTWTDRNRNLAIKQFYSCTIHPAAGSNYMLAGSQDNGSHQFKNSGLSFTTEVTGGDGGYTHINQLNPQIQFTAQSYSVYYRSFNGGQTWQFVSFPSSALFINPFDYDDVLNLMYSCNGPGQVRRWQTTGNTSDVLASASLGYPSAFKVSPHTPNRLFIGSVNGGLVKLDNANSVSNANLAENIQNIRGTSFSNGYINCINTGTSDDHLVAVFTNYGVNNVWYSGNGGTSWTAIDGNLPDMPVRWAVFFPGSNTKLAIATEAGVYTTAQINGSSTVWTPSANFPTVRTDMLKIRPSDNTIVAATHGRGLFTAVIPAASNLPVTLVDFKGRVRNNNVVLDWQTATEEDNAGFDIERSADGVRFNKIGFVGGAGDSKHLRSYTFTDKDIAQENNYYRLRQIDNNGRQKYSKTIHIKYPLSGKAAFTVLKNTLRNTLDLQFGEGLQGSAQIRMLDMNGRVVMRWTGQVQAGTRMRLQVPAHISAGIYNVQLLVDRQQFTIQVRKE